MTWTERSGTKIATLEEGINTSVNLPIEGNPQVNVISGKLPEGMSLIGTTISGTPAEVPRNTEYRFVLRAEIGSITTDRTFRIEVTGPDEPIFQTPEDLLPIGKNETFYILDSSPVDFQIEATDNDILAGQKLSFFIASGDGELPPGITLTESGRLIGVVDPILALEKEAGQGRFDENRYDKFPYDYAVKSLNGFDSFFYDTRTYDFATATRTPKKLNRYFQFTVSVSDGDTIAKRTFRIFVVGDDFLRADNTIMQVGTGIFTADNTFVRTPIWLTPSNLGFRRANNFITLFLDVLDPNTITGEVIYDLLETNEDATESVLPPGTELDRGTGEIFGRVPYQPAITKEYKFTIRATRFTSSTTETAFSDKTFTIQLLGEVDSTIRWLTESDLGTVPSNYVSTISVRAKTSVPNSFLLYSLTQGALPPGLELGFNGEIIGRIDNELITVSEIFTFTIKAQDQFGFSAIEREFSIEVQNLDDTLYTDIYFKPFLSSSSRRDFYEFISDSQIFSPELIYRPNDPRFGRQQEPKILAYAGIERKSADNFVAACAKYAKRKTLLINEVKKAVATKPGTNEIVYEVVYLDIIDPYEKDGDVAKSIKISDFEEITADILSANNSEYRGVRSYIEVGTRNNPINKIFTDRFLTIQTRLSTVNYDIRDLEILARNENLSPNLFIGSSTNIWYRPLYENTIKVDNSNVKVSDPNRNQKYISNTSNLREDILEIGKTERNFLPLWMRSPQPNQAEELGFTLAIPLAYCLPGTADRIISGIRTNNIDFRQFKFEIDRFVIENSLETGNEKYILFANYEYVL